MERRSEGFAALDGMRGVAALLIAMRHTGPFFAPLEFPESFLAVDLFFLLSGAVIAHAYEHKLGSGLSVARFTWIRLVRIYPLYLLGTLLLLGLQLLKGTAPDPLAGPVLLGAVLLPDLGATLTFPLNTPAWSLFLEIVVNVAYAAGLLYLTTARLVAVSVLSAAMLCALVLLGQRHSLDVGWTAKSFGAGFPRVAFSFFAGVVLYRLFRRRGGTATMGNGVSWAVVGLVAAVLMLQPSAQVAPYYELAAALLVFPPVVYLGLLCRPTGGTVTVFRIAGGLSFPLYALHLALGHLVQDGLLAATGREVEAYAPWIGIPFLLFALMVCAVLNRVYDAPVRRWLLSLGGRRARPGPAVF